MCEEEKVSLDYLYKKANGICFVCELKCAREHASREHILPVSLGGTNDESNLTISHKRCNSKRGNGFKPIYSKFHRMDFKHFKLLDDHGLMIQIVPNGEGAYIIVSKKKDP